MDDYLKVVYSEENRPFTTYPGKLCKYLFNRFNLKPNDLLLDLGCGRLEFSLGFKSLGIEVFGADGCESAVDFSKGTGIEVKKADLEKEKVPYPDGFFDIIFCKSFIEHFYYPERIVEEARRLLKPGGKFIVMTPDWEANYKIFYEDYTHRTPFTKTSLNDIYAIHGFSDIKVEKFRQLPLLWKYPGLAIFSKIIALVCPRSKIKAVRFSKEIMLLGYAVKSLN